jgi:hypothetical protein
MSKCIWIPLLTFSYLIVCSAVETMERIFEEKSQCRIV